MKSLNKSFTPCMSTSLNQANDISNTQMNNIVQCLNRFRVVISSDMPCCKISSCLQTDTKTKVDNNKGHLQSRTQNDYHV